MLGAAHGSIKGTPLRGEHGGGEGALQPHQLISPASSVPWVYDDIAYLCVRRTSTRPRSLLLTTQSILLNLGVLGDSRMS